jgi:hypothetical protein
MQDMHALKKKKETNKYSTYKEIWDCSSYTGWPRSMYTVAYILQKIRLPFLIPNDA